MCVKEIFVDNDDDDDDDFLCAGDNDSFNTATVSTAE